MRPFLLSKSTIAPLLLSLTFVISLSGCADSIVSECDIPDGPLPVSSRFSDLEQRVFSVTCAVSGCHAGSNPQAGMDLSAGKAYDALVNIPSLNFPTQRRVAPGQSGESVLIAVLRRTVQPAMPPAGPIASGIVDSIAVWIDRGAPRD